MRFFSPKIGLQKSWKISNFQKYMKNICFLDQKKILRILAATISKNNVPFGSYGPKTVKNVKNTIYYVIYLF